jgi:hypothetical protein
MIVNKIEVPSSIEEDVNKDKTVWKNGQCVILHEGAKDTYYIGHETVTRTVVDEEKAEEKTVTLAFPVKTTAPATRDALINAAEMAVYNLKTAMDVASFAASMARKARENADDTEVKEHDDFIAWVKKELTRIGV